MTTDSWDATLHDTSHDASGAAGATYKSNGFASLFDDPARTLRDQATTKLRGLADSGKGQVTDTLDGVAQAAREIADKLKEGSFGPVGGLANDAAETLERWTHSVKGMSIDDLLHEGEALARRSPALAVGLAVAAGFAVSRILRAGR